VVLSVHTDKLLSPRILVIYYAFLRVAVASIEAAVSVWCLFRAGVCADREKAQEALTLQEGYPCLV